MSFDGVKPMNAWDTNRAADLQKANANRKEGEKFETTAELMAFRMDKTGNDQVVILGDGHCALDAAGVLQIKNPEKYGKYVREGEKGFVKSYEQREKWAKELLREKKMSATSVPTGTVFDLNQRLNIKGESKTDQERRDGIFQDFKNAVGDDAKALKSVQLPKTTVTDVAKMIIEHSDKKEYNGIKLNTPEGQKQFDKLVKALRDDAGLKGFDLTLSEKNKLDFTKYFKNVPGAGETPKKAEPEAHTAEDIAEEITDGKLDVQKNDTPMSIARGIALKLKEDSDVNETYAKLDLDVSDEELAADADFKPILDAVKAKLNMKGKDFNSQVGQEGKYDFSDAYKIGLNPEVREAGVIRDAIDEKGNLDVQKNDTPMSIARGIALKLKEDPDVNETYAKLDLDVSDEELAADADFKPILDAVKKELGVDDADSKIEKEKTYNFSKAYAIGLGKADVEKGRDSETIVEAIKTTGKGHLTDLENFEIKKHDTPQAVLDAIKTINAEGGIDIDEEELLSALQEKMEVKGQDEGVKEDSTISLSEYFTKDDPDFKVTPEEIAVSINTDGTLETQEDYTNYDIAKAIVLKHKDAGEEGDEALRGLNLDEQAALANNEDFQKLLSRVGVLTEQESDNTASVGLKELDLSDLLPKLQD